MTKQLRAVFIFRAEMVDGQVKVQGASAGATGALGDALTEAHEDFQVPTQLRQQFIEVSTGRARLRFCAAWYTALITSITGAHRHKQAVWYM